MSMRWSEHHYQTPEQVREYLREALAIIEELDPPSDLRQTVFAKAADLVSAKHVSGEAVVPGGMLLGQPRV